MPLPAGYPRAAVGLAPGDDALYALGALELGSHAALEARGVALGLLTAVAAGLVPYLQNPLDSRSLVR